MNTFTDKYAFGLGIGDIIGLVVTHITTVVIPDVITHEILAAECVKVRERTGLVMEQFYY